MRRIRRRFGTKRFLFGTEICRGTNHMLLAAGIRAHVAVYGGVYVEQQPGNLRKNLTAGLWSGAYFAAE